MRSGAQAAVSEETEQQRIRRARDLAYEEGRRRQEVDGTLKNHEARLNAINGSIDRGTRATNELRESVRRLHDDFRAFLADQRTRDEVAKFRATEHKEADEKRTEAVRLANEKQISGRAFWIGVVTIVVMLAGVLVASAHLFGATILAGGLW